MRAFFATLRCHYAVGPLLAPFVDSAAGTDIHERKAWQFAVCSAAIMEAPRSLLQALAGGGVRAVLGLALPHFWVWRVLVGIGAALATYWLIPTVWAFVAMLRAPAIQRDQARAAIADERERFEEMLNVER